MNPSLRRIGTLARVLGTATVLATPGPASAEDSKSAEVQRLEKKVEMQDQRIRDLERRLQDMEAALSGRTARDAAVTPPTAAAAQPSPAPEIAKTPPPEPVPTASPMPEPNLPGSSAPGLSLASEEFPGSWPMFGTDLRMKIGGYIKGDLLYDFDGTTDKEQLLMSTIPVEGTPEYDNDGYLSFFARDTRFNIDVRRDTPGAAPLRGFVEGDFWGEGKFRLRHAFITYGDFLVGQTWTTLSFLESLPFIIDFGGGDALFGGRAAQIRYSRNVGDRWKLALAAENLNYPGIENPNSLGGKASNQLPLFAFRADYKWRSTWLVFGSSIAQLHWDGGTTAPSDTALQIDAMLGLRQYLGTNNYVTCNLSYGQGSGENILAFAGSSANAVLNANGQLETMPAFALVLGYWHRWSEQLSSNFSYAYGWLDTPDSRAPLSLKEGGIIHANLIWDVTKHFSTGIEYIYGEQRTSDDSFGSATRIQTMAMFKF